MDFPSPYAGLASSELACSSHARTSFSIAKSRIRVEPTGIAA
jgi:hypothetical protein